ncbi:hypothetical protein BKH46_07805 [Helicobacter sp. 12S02634-8]|uniref:pilus assembly FimT family protein n=1 Tax=Helicobacter sp. 12S02634-8 TaxID=1476199 RepID=UPI000BA7254D|nr:hypothetical protein [Helicobacter sp. 12S02634-8]PAF46365.1 hypothetical protein BKH46_07805 [Helicobacter sp. 12S02634-8]
MRASFSLLEIVFALMLLGILASFGFPKTETTLSRAANSLLEHIAYTRHLALNDNLIYTHIDQTHSLKKRFRSIDPTALIQKNPMWQLQWHFSGKYAHVSYSIYVDTPRFAPTTHYDGRPMDGDIIAINGGDRRCLSGYNNTSISEACKNNSSVFVRLSESYGIEHLYIQGDKVCKETRGGRVFFDRFGLPYCSREAIRLTQPLKIILEKRNQSKTICILPSGYSFLMPKGGDCEAKNSYFM